jgi:Phosphoesterase family
MISPFSRGGNVVSQVFDHTSQLKLVAERFGMRELQHRLPGHRAGRRGSGRSHRPDHADPAGNDGPGHPVRHVSGIQPADGEQPAATAASNEQQRLIALLPADQATADKLRELR